MSWRKQMFRPIVSFECFGNSRNITLYPPIFQRRQFQAIALARHNGSYNPQARLPAQVTDDVLQLEVHLRQRTRCARERLLGNLLNGIDSIIRSSPM